MTDHPPSDSVFSEKGFPQTRTQVLTEADVLITAALVDRLARQPDLAAENQAFVRLAQQLTDDPQSRLKALVQIARDLCQADTVGVSLLETLADGSSVFRWVAIAGVLEGLEQTAVPSNSPCGATIRCGQPQLYARPERYFTYLHQSQFPIVEGLVIPICVNDQPLGTLWILSHTEQRQFDREDLRLMASLAGFAAAALQNVNLRQTAALALQESEAFNHSIFESSADCIKLLDLNGCLLSMNGPGLCLMEVKDCTPLVGTAWIEFWQDSDRADAAQAVKTAKAGRTGRLSGYCPTLKGTSKWWDVVVTPVLDVLGQPKQLLVISRDISDRKSAEAEREQLLQQEQAAREAAEQANQIKDEFLAVPSHELRSPLNPILGWTKLLRRGKLNTGKTAEALATIERNAKLQCQLIEDLLDISRVMQGKLLLNVAPVSLAFVISSAIETVRLAAEVKNIGIEVYLEPHMGQVSGDAGRLQQVVWNLLSNAVKFSPTGGSVEVRLTQVNHQAQLQVVDAGKGISPEFLPYVFEHFRQEDGATTRKFGGLGLGLAIARQIVALHGGRIWVESLGEDQGATFTVELPLLQTVNPVEEVTDSIVVQAETLPLANLRVLIVDDEPDSREVIEFVVEQAGAEVTAVSSAIEALQQLSTTSFDLLLSDISMPEIDGYELMRQISQTSSELGEQVSTLAQPVPLPAEASPLPKAIALTAYAGEINQQQALSAGFQRHLTKPVEPDELIRTIVMMVNQKGIEVEPT